jgi:hypothetical protein
MNGRNSIVPSKANSNGVTLSVVAAMIGRASNVTCVPNWLIVWADQSFTKSGWRRRLRLASDTKPSTACGRGEPR